MYSVKKKFKRVEIKVCLKCGHNPCSCRLPKGIRKTMPAVLASRARLKREIVRQIEPWEFRLLTLRVTEETYKPKKSKVDEVIEKLDRGA